MPRFPNREQAGRQLAAQLLHFQNQQVLVMAGAEWWRAGCSSSGSGS